MHRNKLLHLLAGYQSRHPAEDVTRFRRFVERQPRCFERDCFDDGHITSSAVVLSADASALLMTLHAKLGKWLQLGGHADGETDPLAVACREAREESGLAAEPIVADAVDVDIHAIPAGATDPAHLHYDLRFLLRAEPGPLTVTHESVALEWVPLDAVGSVTREESILRLVAKCRTLIAALPNASMDTRAMR